MGGALSLAYYYSERSYRLCRENTISLKEILFFLDLNFRVEAKMIQIIVTILIVIRMDFLFAV